MHNLWLNLRDPQGRRWLLGHAAKVLSRRDPLGDRRMDYRGINGMYVHLYRWGELKRELRLPGFRIDQVIPLDEVSAAPIRMPWLVPSIRAVGGSCSRAAALTGDGRESVTEALHTGTTQVGSSTNTSQSGAWHGTTNLGGSVLSDAGRDRKSWRPAARRGKVQRALGVRAAGITRVAHKYRRDRIGLVGSERL